MSQGKGLEPVAPPLSRTMKRLWPLLAALCLAYAGVGRGAETDDAVRQKLVQTLSADGAEQQRLLGELADSGEKSVRDVLVAWTRDGVFWYEAAGVKIPVLLEEQADADGK